MRRCGLGNPPFLFYGKRGEEVSGRRRTWVSVFSNRKTVIDDGQAFSFHIARMSHGTHHKKRYFFALLTLLDDMQMCLFYSDTIGSSGNIWACAAWGGRIITRPIRQPLLCKCLDIICLSVFFFKLQKTNRVGKKSLRITSCSKKKKNVLTASIPVVRCYPF